MGALTEHALREFRAAGWIDENGKFADEMQEAICNDAISLLEVFADQGHSGTSAPYVIALFQKLAEFEPIVPLTGEPDEWEAIDDRDGKYFQNRRCSHVFKDEDRYGGKAYDIEGTIFFETHADEDGKEYKSFFTGRDSIRVIESFPYTPEREYKEARREPLPKLFGGT